MNQTVGKSEIQHLLNQYFDGLYNADSKMLSEVFHPDARYINSVSGSYCNLSVVDYFRIIDERISPAESGEGREEKIDSIAFAGPSLATVRAEMIMMGRRYTDCLTLIRTNNGWAIIAKAFHYTTEGEQ